VFVIAKHHDLLRRLGLDSIEGVKKFQGELIKNHKGQRDIQRIRMVVGQAPSPVVSRAGAPACCSAGEAHETVTGEGACPTKEGRAEVLVFYLKRNWRPYKKDGLKSLVTRGEVWSQSRVEWENSLVLQRAGIAVAEPIAFGEECGIFREKFSFILTAAAPGDMTLEDFLRGDAPAGERFGVLRSLAAWIRKMHDAGLASPDLFTRHIFVERARIRLPQVPPGETIRMQASEPRFCLIDMARLDHRRKLSPALRARDLAALNVTAPLRFVSTRERLRFLKFYGDRALRRLIIERTKHLLTRRKFADFAAR